MGETGEAIKGCPKCGVCLADVWRDHFQYCVPGLTIADWRAIYRGDIWDAVSDYEATK